MSLFDSASLVVTPNGYKEDKLYSIKPSDGSGDLVVTRATTATRVNSDGLIEQVPYNLLTYSNTFTNAIWTKENSSITTSQAGYDGTNNASLLVENSTNNNHFIRQTPSLSGQITISVYAKANTRNWLYLRGVQAGVPVFGWFNLSNGTLGTIQNNGTGSIQSVGNGWYRCSLTIANFNTGFETYIGISTADNTITYLGNGSSIFIQNTQINSGSSAKEYFPTTDRLDVPRLDYTNSTCPSILVEPQRTNLALYSEQFENAYWTKNSATITSNTSISPDGTQNADTILGSGFIGKNILQSGIHTFSVFAKAGTSNEIRLNVFDGTTDRGVYYNLSNGTITSSYGTIIASNIVSYGNGWYRISITTNNATRSYVQIHRDSAQTCFIWGAQLEAGSNATSYIPTIASSVTRNADVISKTGISSLIGQTEGTLFLEAKGFSDGNASFQFITLNDGSTNNQIGFSYNASGIIQGYFRVNAVTNTISSSVSKTLNSKIILKYSSNNYKLFINGVLIGSGTSASGFSSPLTVFKTSQGNDGFPYNGNVKTIAIFKTALTDQECINLTTI